MCGVTTLEPPDPPTVDGRRARGERTRAAIITAFVQLLEDGEIKPTGAQIAAGAGISIRAPWANFSDLETLYDATGRVLFARSDARKVVIRADLPLPGRIDRFCADRATACERIAPFAKGHPPARGRVAHAARQPQAGPGPGGRRRGTRVRSRTRRGGGPPRRPGPLADGIDELVVVVGAARRLRFGRGAVHENPARDGDPAAGGSGGQVRLNDASASASVRR